MKTPRTFLKKALVGWLTYAMTFGPGTPGAMAAGEPDNFLTSTDYSNVPLPAKKRPNPNMIMAIDDSGSMDGEIAVDANDGAAWYATSGHADGSVGLPSDMPGFIGYNSQDQYVAPTLGSFNYNFNRDGAADDADPTFKKYVYLFPNGACGANCATRSYDDANHSHFAVPPTPQFAYFRSSDHNKQYYNPATTYLPWKPYNDGSGTCPSGTATGTGSTYLCTPGNANPAAARSHPIHGTSTMNLTATVAKSQAQHFKFRMYVGMVIPSGADYRECQGWNEGGTCDSWRTVNTGQNLCIDDHCPPGPLHTGFTNRGANAYWSGSRYDHVEAGIAYFPATYYVAEKNPNYAAYAAFPRNSMNGVTDLKGPDLRSMRMVEIKPTTLTYPKAATRTDCAAASCTYAEEIQNFANWFQYYRKRHLSLNAAIGNSMDGLNALRAGYFLFNNRFNVTMHDFDVVGDFTANERRLLGNIYRTKGNGGTPTRESMDWMGQQYQRTGSGAPITAPCQFNAGFIITDGFATQSGPTTYGNIDNATAGAKGPIGVGYTDPITGNPLAPRPGDANFFNQQMGPSAGLPDPTGTGVTAPIADNWSNTLADMAMRFYTTNLRPDLQTGRVPVDVNDLAPDADKNPNLHMNTYGLVLGLSGLMFGNLSTSALQAMNSDPYTNNPNWNAINPTSTQRSPSAIDELWHATINGRGTMLKADSPEETRNAVLDVVNNVVAKGGAAAAVSVSNAIPTTGDNFLYQTSYNAGAWAGDLNAYNIDLQSGAVSATPAWALSAQRQLADRDWTTRLIVSYDPNATPTPAGVPFRATSGIGATQLAALGGMTVGPTAVQPAWVLDWLRGDRSREGQTLRSRGPRKDPTTGLWKNNVIPNNVAVLGDLVNAEPVYVREPRANFFDEGYSTYKTSYANRTRALYAAGNDGMVHVFDATTGAEKWAYVPSFGFQAQSGFTTPGLRNLADKEFFSHRFLVDATPVTSDIDLAKAGNTTTGSSNWATMVVGGLGKGGRGYYAINATSSDAANEAAAAAKIMWEFPNSATPATTRANVGWTFGRPVIAKTKAAGWVVLVSSGYENGNETGGDGRGHLFVLNPLNGNVIADLQTLDASDGANDITDRRNNPRGLAYISAFSGNPNTDPSIDYVYGGDLYGNVWRFDLSGAYTTDWNVTKLATLTDGSNRQPVTSEPELGVVGSSRVVYVGTGRYYGDKDIPGATGAFVSATGTQTMYALKDDRSTNPTIAGRAELVGQTVTKSGGFANVTNNAVDFSTTKGWYVDFPDAGERIITNPSLAAGVLAIATNIPDGSDVCLPGGRSWLYAFDYRTGSVIPGATYAGKFLGDALASRVNMIRVGSGVKGLIRTSAGDTKVADEPGRSPAFSAKRKAWREILR
jgi:type IV pilus assembly protein PilY1